MKIAKTDNSISFNGFVDPKLAKVITRNADRVISQRVKSANKAGHILNKSELSEIEQVYNLLENISKYMGKTDDSTYLAAVPKENGNYLITIQNYILKSSLQLFGGKCSKGSIHSEYIDVPAPILKKKKPNIFERFAGIDFGVEKSDSESFIKKLVEMNDILNKVTPGEIDEALFKQSYDSGFLSSIKRDILLKAKEKSSFRSMSEKRDKIRVYNIINKIFHSPDQMELKPYRTDFKDVLSNKINELHRSIGRFKIRRINSKNLHQM